MLRRSLLLLFLSIPLCSQTSQVTPAENKTTAQDNGSHGSSQSETQPPATAPFPPDLLCTLTANTGNTTGRVVASDTSDAAGLALASGPPQTDGSEPINVAGYCAALAGTNEYSPTLAKVCEFALSVPTKLPDILCERETKRYWKTRGDETLFDKASKVDFDDVNHADVITAQVTYRDGQEYEENVRVDGKPADAAAPWSSGAWSLGEFALSLNTIFMPSSKPVFRYRKQEKLHSIPAVVFDFHVSAENNKLYYLRSGDKVWFPEYSGKLWLEKNSSRLLRLERETADMPNEPITRMKTATEYSLVGLGDGTEMVLPTRADVLICPGYASLISCARNIVTFSKWQKFRATTNVILNPK